jgi:hypothetical protein
VRGGGSGRRGGEIATRRSQERGRGEREDAVKGGEMENEAFYLFLWLYIITKWVSVHCNGNI